MNIQKHIGRGLVGVFLVVGLTQSAIAQVQGVAFQGTNAAGTNYFLGKTGIGTNNPAKQLHVVGDSKLQGGLTVDGAFQVPKQGDVSMGSYTNGVSNQGVASSNLALRGTWISYDGSSQGLYVSTNGNVGVGTNAPGVALQVNGAARAGSLTVDGGLTAGAGTFTNLTLGGVARTGWPGTNAICFSVYLSTDTNSGGGEVKVPFDSENFDVGGCYNTSTKRFVPTVAGYYQFNANVHSSKAGSGARFAILYKNGAGVSYGVYSTEITMASAISTVSAVVYANGSTDYFEVYLYSAASTTFVGVAAYTEFNGVLVLPASP